MADRSASYVVYTNSGKTSVAPEDHLMKVDWPLYANCLPRIFLLLCTMLLIQRGPMHWPTVRLVHTLITRALARQLQPEAQLLKFLRAHARALKHKKIRFHHDPPRNSGSAYCTRITKGLLLCFLIGGHMYTRLELSSLHLIVDLK
jgi:hypothetical protein